MRRQRLLIWGIAFLILLTLSGAGFFLHLNGNITKVPVDRPGARPPAAESLDVLLIGSDTREGDSAAFQGEGLDAVAGARSDTSVLLHVPADGSKALLISFPRDLWVTIPSCTREGRGPSTATRGRLNKAFTIGGASCTIGVVEDLTGIRVDDYILVDFASFERVVDALGGVPFCTPVPLEDPFVPRRGDSPGYGTGLSLPAGTTTLDGTQALALARARYGIGDGGDLGRIQRQQQLLAALVRRATSSRLLLNPARLVTFLNQATRSVTTGGMKLTGLKKLAGRLRDLEPGKVTFVTVPTTPRADRATLDVAPAAQELFQALRSDTPVPGGERPPAATAVDIKPSAVRVRVLNGTGETGRARKAADELSTLGFVVVEIADADSPDYAETVVRHGPLKSESADTLVAAVPGSKKQPDGSLTRTLELVIGEDYTATAAVTVRPRPGSLPPTTTAADDPCT